MQTVFTADRLAEPGIGEAGAIIRNCVHCGFCTATCPTFVLKGDELDSPRGRIWLMKDMLEKGGPPAPVAVKHIDRCLSCLSCMTTCPSDVNYMHLVDTARAYIEKHHVRPLPERLLRALLPAVLTRRWAFRAAVRAAGLLRPLHRFAPGRLAGLLGLAPRHLPRAGAAAHPGLFAAQGARRGRVALQSGCVQPVLRPGIDEAAVRLLTRHGVEVEVAAGGACCGAMDHHLGRHERAVTLAKANVVAWEAVIARDPVDAILVTASGCGTVIRDYPAVLAGEPAWAERAQRIAALSVDVSVYLARLSLRPVPGFTGFPVAYHAACSLQHGQRVRGEPRALLAAAGFEVREVAEGHLCCGSAGVYNILQPEIAGQLRRRKLGHIAATGAHVIASGNIGCLTQLGTDDLPAVHLVELLDWSCGGPRPRGLA